MPVTTYNDLLKILVECVAVCLGGEYDLTSGGVPRIIFECAYMRTDKDGASIDNRPMKISVVYLASSNQWKAFWPFPSDEQQKQYFKTISNLVEWLYDMGVVV